MAGDDRGEAGSKPRGLVDMLLLVHEDNVRLRAICERQAKASEEVAAQLVTLLPAILTEARASRVAKTEKKRGPVAEAIHAFGQLPASARLALVLLAPSLLVIGMAVHELFFK